MRHRSLITPLALLVVLMVISCSLGARLPTPTATIPPVASSDSDGDRVPDAEDNCPITPNPDQADADTNGLGDVCDAPFLDGFACLTPQGVIQSSVDERLRLAKIVAPEGTITFVWSEDATRVDLIVETAGESKTFTLEIDLRDPALLAALDADEAETDRDLSALRAWIVENPGQVLAVASGEQPPPRLAPTPDSSLLPSTILLVSANIPVAQGQRKDDVIMYIDSLSDLYFVTDRVLLHLREQHPEWDIGVRRAEDILENLKNALLDLWVGQAENCIGACTHLCNIDCNRGGEGEGACFLDYPRISPCYMYLEQDCANIEGTVFYPGQTCPGACWVSAGGVSDCYEMDEESCREWPSRANIPGHGFDMTILAFCPGQPCYRPMCTPPAP